MKKILIIGGSTLIAASAYAQGTAAAEMEDITANVTAINTLWGTVATVVIGVAAVMVGVRFLRRLGR